ncbi:hypothetical protein NQ318_014820 [Aromia moschata]|uniref:PiggyBac transposable element-derived protein domain-containing protein n=1 Tax=Aromia moschata TaxID=1265417 RepID=A0AAV8ZE11_9CUCU|nr:hypothetical protein NQ318_014820 [Aromia moschata]
MNRNDELKCDCSKVETRFHRNEVNYNIMWKEIGPRLTVDLHFYKSIIFSDESTFPTNGVVSSQNCRFWA